MKNPIKLIFVLFALVFSLTLPLACTPGQKSVVKTALDFADFACITAHADLPDSNQIAVACGIATEMIPTIKQVVDDFKAKREGYAAERMSAAHCPDKSLPNGSKLARMAKVRPLTADEARRTLANRFGGRVDGLRQLATKFGLRPYRVFLTWTKWSGSERGEGSEQIVQRTELLPTPRVQSLDSVTFGPFHGGTLPVGSIRIDRISATYTQDVLRGLLVPIAHEDHLPEPYEFYYEVVEDGRGDPQPVRAKYRLLSAPFRRAGKVDWTITLERISQDRTRDDQSAVATGRE